MPIHNPRTDDRPFDRLTHLAEIMINAFDAAENHEPGDRCIAIAETDSHFGIAVNGYSDRSAVLASMLQFVQGIFAASGKRLDVMAVDEDGIHTIAGPEPVDPADSKENN